MTVRSLAAIAILLGAAHVAAAQDPATIAVREGIARNIYVPLVELGA